jgi:hypothetical protein
VASTAPGLALLVGRPATRPAGGRQRRRER